jgi:hypothetical protein
MKPESHERPRSPDESIYTMVLESGAIENMSPDMIVGMSNVSSKDHPEARLLANSVGLDIIVEMQTVSDRQLSSHTPAEYEDLLKRRERCDGLAGSGRCEPASRRFAYRQRTHCGAAKWYAL